MQKASGPEVSSNWVLGDNFYWSSCAPGYLDDRLRC